MIICFRLHELKDTVLQDERLPDEMLYGRAGYLYSLLLLRKYLGDAAVSQTVIDQVMNKL